MNKSDVMALLEKGKPVVMGEFRRFKGEVIRWRDKTSGKALEAPSMRFTVETDEETFEVSDFTDVPEGSTAEAVVSAYKCPFKKGARVLVEIKSWIQQKGVVKCRGLLHVLEG